MSLRVAFRVDASAEIGTGHFMRCLTLADALAERGATARFASRQLPESLQRLARDHGHEVSLLTASFGISSEGEDARATAAALADRRWHWLVVDNYSLGAAWEREMRATSLRLLVIDDLADRAHDCDVLLDQNYLQQGAERYRGRVPRDCRLLIGPLYALLRPEYRAALQQRLTRSGPVRRVLVFLGGTDPQNMTALALEALALPELEHLSVDVVTGSDPGRRLALEEQVRARPGVTVHGPRPHLADLMLNADLALGAGGSTTWERMCVGLRSLVITLADNQVHVAKWLAHEGLINLIGHAGQVSVDDVRRALLVEMAQQESGSAASTGTALCDGEGVSRVVDAMLAAGAGPTGA